MELYRKTFGCIRFVRDRSSKKHFLNVARQLGPTFKDSAS